MEQIKFTRGFTKESINYGWDGQQLYRLPSVKNKRVYPLLRLSLIKVGASAGYNIARKKLIYNQCLALTEKFSKPKIYFITQNQ